MPRLIGNRLHQFPFPFPPPPSHALETVKVNLTPLIILRSSSSPPPPPPPPTTSTDYFLCAQPQLSSPSITNMVQSSRVFVALALLSPMISLLALAGGSLWTEDHKYRECMNHDPGCAKYLNITSICTQLAKDGNFTIDPVKYQKNLLKCNCPDPQYLPGLKVYAH